MAELIKMPRLSDTMEEGTVATWFKKVGDTISEGDILAEIETDKATMEFESFYDGTLLYIGVKEGETTKVDQPLAIIGDKGEDYKSLLDEAINTVNIWGGEIYFVYYPHAARYFSHVVHPYPLRKYDYMLDLAKKKILR